MLASFDVFVEERHQSSAMKFSRRNPYPVVATLLVLGVLCTSPSAWATNAACESDWGWVRVFIISVLSGHCHIRSSLLQSYNSKGQNPCEIAASLQGPCFGQCTRRFHLRSNRPLIKDVPLSSIAGFELGPLDPGNRYAGPQKKTPLRKRCGCNTVIFGLYMACTLCQNTTTSQTWEP